MVAEHLLEGRRGERIACRYLLRRGFDILARRYSKGRGEIDVIAFEAETLVFIEVKTRSSARYGEPWEFVDERKRLMLQRTADSFIAEHDLGRYAYRFDIVAVLLSRDSEHDVRLFRNAF